VSYHELEAELAGAERALERLDDGTYGTCEACGGPIDEGLLESAPTLALCAEHQKGP
jgi:DnaK suppressor protein